MIVENILISKTAEGSFCSKVLEFLQKKAGEGGEDIRRRIKPEEFKYEENSPVVAHFLEVSYNHISFLNPP